MTRFLPLALIAGAAASIAVAAASPAEAWQIGPIIRGKNYSVGISGTLRPGPQGPWFAFPEQGRGHIHYVTLPIGSIEGARQITVRYRIDAGPGTRFIAQQTQGPGKFGLAFQRAGDNWSARGKYETYRWYSPAIRELTPGVHSFTVRFDDPRWVGVMHSTASTNPQAFADARAQAASVSLTFGDESGRGHGVFATGAAKFTLLDFRIS